MRPHVFVRVCVVCFFNAPRDDEMRVKEKMKNENILCDVVCVSVMCVSSLRVCVCVCGRRKDRFQGCFDEMKKKKEMEKLMKKAERQNIFSAGSHTHALYHSNILCAKPRGGGKTDTKSRRRGEK